MLKMANNQGDIGYIGYVPAILARTQGIPMTVVAASETEGTSEADNWQNVVVDGSSSIRTPADLAGKTVAVNALKGVSEVVVKGALEKRGVDPDSVNYTVMPFPTMPSALASGLVDAVHTPEPFMSQILAAAIRNIRLPNWSPLIDRVQLLELARLMKKYDVIDTLPNFTKLVPSFVEGGRTLQATVGQGSFLTLRLDGKIVSKLRAGNFTIAVADKSTKDNFHLTGAGLNRSTSVAKKENATWILNLKKGVYQYSSDGSSKRKGTFRVT